MFARAVAATVIATGCCAAIALAPTPASAVELGTPQVLADTLALPWEVVALGDGRLLVSEYPGRIRVWSPGSGLDATPAYSEADARFLGMAKHPNFAANQFVYLFANVARGDGTFFDRVTRMRLNGGVLDSARSVIAEIPGERNHDGGRIAFGPDGLLYVLTGDTHNPAFPRDPGVLAGKVLRIQAPGDDSDGSPAAGAPFPGSPLVWSIGHRNPQGLAFDRAGRLFSTEHGPSGEAYAGGRCCRDEINLIEGGGDYGWPDLSGDDTATGARPPIVTSGNSIAWAPSGATFAPDGRLYVATLLGQHLREFTLQGTAVVGQRELLGGTFGRLRTVVVDGSSLLITTSNSSGAQLNDRLIRVPFTVAPGEQAAVPGERGGTPSPTETVTPGNLPAPAGGGVALAPAKLEVRRARVAGGKLDVFARISARATGRVRVIYESSGTTTRFEATIAAGVVRFVRALPARQRVKTTGILTLGYDGNARVRAQSVRLRAANGRARLVLTSASIDAQDHLRVRGTIASGARGLVLVRMDYDTPGGVRTIEFGAPIRAGRWTLDKALPAGPARAGGQLSIQFTGYEARRIRGEQIARQVAGRPDG